MKKAISLFIVFVLVFIPFGFCTTAVEVSDQTTVVVTQSNSSYAGFSNTSPAFHGEITTGSSHYPISLCSTRSTLSVLDSSSVYPSTVEVLVSDPRMQDGGSLYVAFWNGYGAFLGGENPDILFNWDDSIPGYYPKYSTGSTLGYTNGSGINVSNPSNFSVTWDLLRTGTTYSVRNGTATVVTTVTANNPVPNSNGSGSVLVQPYYKTGSSSVKLLSVSVPSGPFSNATCTTVKLTFDSNDVCKANITSSNTSQYLHSGIFIPLAVFIPSNTTTEVGLLNQVLTKLTTIITNQSNISIDLNDILGYLYDGDTSVIEALDQILGGIINIDNGLSAVTGNQYESAVQYIEYYLNAVLGNTNTMVTQLNNITATLNQIANTIGAANTDAQDAVQNAEDVHDYEQDIYSQANIDIGSTVISSFAFDGNTSSGLARAGLDFTDLWGAIRQWNVVYTFSMILTLAFTIIRFTRVSHKSKKSEKE